MSSSDTPSDTPNATLAAPRWIAPLWVQRGVMLLLALLLAVGMLPAYLSGQWPWVTAPQVPHMDAVQNLGREGLELPNWQLTTHQDIAINRQTWRLNEYQATGRPTPGGGSALSSVAVLLYPQPWHSNQPQVEWMDIIGAQNWRVDGRQRLRFPDEPTVQANFFRAWGDRPMAVLQWYSWPSGGHPSPSRWFWANQRSQLATHSLTPWVAVTLVAPLPASGELGDMSSQLVALGETVHRQVVADMQP